MRLGARQTSTQLTLSPRLAPQVGHRTDRAGTRLTFKNYIMALARATRWSILNSPFPARCSCPGPPIPPPKHAERTQRIPAAGRAEEPDTTRTQEFVLRWSSDGGNSVKEIVRQQWNFSPPNSIREVEDYKVELSNVTVLELTINPSIAGGVARASLKNLRLS